MKAIKWERNEVGFGKKMLETAVQSKRSTAVVVQQKVKAMAEKIIKEEMRVAGLTSATATTPKSTPPKKGGSPSTSSRVDVPPKGQTAPLKAAEPSVPAPP